MALNQCQNRGCDQSGRKIHVDVARTARRRRPLRGEGPGTDTRVTLLAVLSLGLGIMAVTAIYSVLYAVVLDPFPYKDVANLTSVRVSNPAQRGGRTGYSTDQFLDIAERSTIFEGVIASTISDVLWTGNGDPQRLRGNHGTFNTFDVMGGADPRADAGRRRRPARRGTGGRAGISLRQRQFGGDPNVLGRQLRLNDINRTVIGVMPKRFMWRGADVYLPVTFERGKTVEGVRGVHLLGRLKSGSPPRRRTPTWADHHRP